LKLIHLLQGDLDWIVMKGLDKDRTRRYQSARGLAMDIQRHLDGDPVLARPPSFRYRAGKWIRKHKGPAVAVSAVLLALCAGLIVSMVLYLRERKARAGESLHRAKAETETAKSMQTARFISEMLSGIDPSQARGRDVSVLTEMLEGAAKRVETQLKDQPEVEASVRLTIGHAYRAMALYPKAELHLERARANRERVFGPNHPETLLCLQELVDLYREQGRSAEARTLCRQALDASVRTAGASAPLSLELQERLALLHAEQRDYAEAERLQLEVIERSRQRGDNELDTFKARGTLAAIYLQQRKFSKAEPIHRETLAGLQRLLEPEHPGVLQEMANLAASLHGLGRLDEAEALYRQTWEVNKRVHGTEHQKSLITMQNLASLLSSQGKHADAETLMRQAVDIARTTLGAEHPRTLRAVEALTVALSRQKKYKEAEELARQILEINRRVSGPEHPRTLRLMVNVGDVLARQREGLTEAETIYRQVLAVQNRVLGPEHPDSLLTAGNLLLVQRRVKNFRGGGGAVPRDH
jgi:tetratricopeptide (TPR) repeat protein